MSEQYRDRQVNENKIEDNLLEVVWRQCAGFGKSGRLG